MCENPSKVDDHEDNYAADTQEACEEYYDISDTEKGVSSDISVEVMQ